MSEKLFALYLRWIRGSLSDEDFVQAIIRSDRERASESEAMAAMTAERDTKAKALDIQTKKVDVANRERDFEKARADGLEAAGREQAARADQNQADMLAEKARAENAEHRLKAQDDHLAVEIARSEELGREVERLRVELNQMREAHGLKLAAIRTAAIMNTRDSFAKAEIDRTHPAWTAAYGDTRDAVRREIALREGNERLRSEVERKTKECAEWAGIAGHNAGGEERAKADNERLREIIGRAMGSCGCSSTRAILREADAPPAIKADGFDLAAYIKRQREWSERTFGKGTRTNGITRHIAKEIVEIRNAPFDLHEWIDVVILAFDGAWRSGHTEDEIVRGLIAKQQVNFSRRWPPAKDVDPDQPSEHVREADAPPAATNPLGVSETVRREQDISEAPSASKPRRMKVNPHAGPYHAKEHDWHPSCAYVPTCEPVDAPGENAK